MKKIYSKMTKERRKGFQIETYIAEDAGKRYVAKRALNAQAVSHIRKMAEYYLENKSMDSICPSVMLGEETIVFDYLSGKSLCRELLDVLREKNREQFFLRLKAYTEFVEGTIEEENVNFNSLEAYDWKNTFAEVFGVPALSDTYVSGRNLNIDLTFDNIIKSDADSKYRMIDYEWLFTFPVPLKFVYYRAAYAFYIRYGSMMGEVVSYQELLEHFSLSQEETEAFEQMNASFNAYVYGGETGYNQITKAYRRSVYDVKKLIPEENLFLQVFLNDGTAYLEDKAVTRVLPDKKIDIIIPVVLSEQIKEIRIDPMNVSGILENLKVEVKTGETEWTEITEFRHNAILFGEKDWIFCSEDPQVIFENRWGTADMLIRVQFTIFEAGMQENPALVALQKKQEELELIKSSKVYKTLMAKKMDKLLGEAE